MIGVVYGGNSCEHDISVITALSIYKTMNKISSSILIYLRNGTFYIGEKLSKIETYKTFNEKGLKKCIFSKGKLLIKTKFGINNVPLECVVMCNHGGEGENGSLSGYFDIAEIPYTASGVFGSSLCMDKVYSKLMLEKLGMPVVDFIIFSEKESIDSLKDAEYPIIIKPARLGSSVGIKFVKNFEELRDGIKFALQFDKKLLIERGLSDFREFNCAVFAGKSGIVISDVEEVFSKKDYLDYEDKYLDGTESSRVIPAEISDETCREIQNIAQKIYQAFELKGVVRIDFLLSDNKLYVNEINTIPGSLSGYMFQNGGITLYELLEETIYTAKKKIEENKSLVQNFSSNVLQYYDGIKTNGVKK